MKEPSPPCKISVVGTITWDRIHMPDGNVAESFGGICYSFLTLVSLLRSTAEVTPISLVGGDRYNQLVKFLNGRSGLNLSGIKSVNQKNNRVTLTYNQYHERTEVLDGSVPSLEFDQIQPFCQAEYILINLISGWDVSLEALRQLREKSRAKIYLDLHSLMAGKDPSGKRFPLRPVDWQEYVQTCDFLQLNLPELETVAGRKLDLNELKEESQKLLDPGPGVVLVTLGGWGCHLTYKKEGGMFSTSIPAQSIGPIKDVTGCGDVFGAGFLAHFITSGDLTKAAEFANDVAGLKATFSGLNGLNSLPGLKSEIQR